MAVVQDVCERVVVIAHGRLITDEHVATLLRLFATRAFDARLGAPLTPAQAAELRRAFPLVSVSDDGLEVRVDLERGDDLYRFIDVLRRERTPVESLDRVAVRFEEVFRHLVNGDEPARRSEGADGAGRANGGGRAREEISDVA
jgi:ABC-2 type transport system ATP-binding protein